MADHPRGQEGPGEPLEAKEELVSYSAHYTCWLLWKAPDELSEREAAYIAALKQLCPPIAETQRLLTASGFSPPQAAGLCALAVRRHGFGQTSRLIAGSSCLCENGWQDTLHLTNPLLFAGSVVRRSHREKQERMVEELHCASRWVALEVTLA